MVTCAHVIMYESIRIFKQIVEWAMFTFSPMLEEFVRGIIKGWHAYGFSVLECVTQLSNNYDMIGRDYCNL